jgi:glycine cleavage system H protein
MTNIPTELKYTKDHEWLKIENESGIIGITDYAQESLGDITFVELPSPGDNLAKGDTLGVVESVKAASDLYMPVSGEILEVNADLENSPELLNKDPYESGWLLKIKIQDQAETESLLSAADYATII